MAISRGHRKVSKSKAEAEQKKNTALTIKTQSNKRRRKKVKAEEHEAGMRNKRFNTRRFIRNKTIQRAKREAKKEKKLLKKAKYHSEQKPKVKKAKAPKTKHSRKKSELQKELDKHLKKLKEIQEGKTDVLVTPDDSKWTEEPAENWGKTEEINYLDDVIYSTFEANLTEMGEYDEVLKEIVQHSIDTFGFEAAMKRLENYMYSVPEKHNIFNVPLQYEGVAIKAITRFASDMLDRPLSLEEMQSYENRLDYLTSETNYKGSHAAISYLRSIQE